MNRTLAVETSNKIGEKIVLFGWINTVRDHGKVSFYDMRDASGIVQTVTREGFDGTSEDGVKILGTVKARPENLVNPNIETGKVEVEIESLEVLSRARELPFPIDGDGLDIDEALRLKYRYLDLRRPRLNANIKMRHEMISFMRKFLSERRFVEIETPILTKATPEGARDFLVPARLAPGKFYALPQSPQQYKQLLMVAGFERYFQIARCFRDEDPRADRAY